jgi:hypothetical protein
LHDRFRIGPGQVNGGRPGAGGDRYICPAAMSRREQSATATTLLLGDDGCVKALGKRSGIELDKADIPRQRLVHICAKRHIAQKRAGVQL